jgi:hypothetical protein
MTEQEKQELLKAALVLVDSMEVGERVSAEQLREAVETVKRHRPKPKLVEGWVAEYGYNHPNISMHFRQNVDALKRDCPTAKRYVHVREVIDPPKWDKWAAYLGPVNIEISGRRVSHCDIQAIADAHNAEMERLIAAWKGGE